MLFVPLNRSPADPIRLTRRPSCLNIDQALSITRSADDTHTRIRGTSVYTPPDTPVIEVLVVETPDEIAALVNAARSWHALVPRRM